MKVILQVDVSNVGRKNEVKDVSDGYARNFLLPRRMALLATDAVLTTMKNKKEQNEQRNAHEEAVYRSIAERLASMTFEFKTKVGEKGKAFGSINVAQIREALHKQGIAVEKDWILLDSPIKTTGEHAVTITFPHGIIGTAKLNIQPQ